jgi:hypothetical protein
MPIFYGSTELTSLLVPRTEYAAPTITVQPVGATVPDADVHPLSVTANSNIVGIPDLAYQWYQAPTGVADWVAIPGATASTYNYTGVFGDPLGLLFACAIYDSRGQSTISATATMVVQAPLSVPLEHHGIVITQPDQTGTIPVYVRPGYYIVFSQSYGNGGQANCKNITANGVGPIWEYEQTTSVPLDRYWQAKVTVGVYRIDTAAPNLGMFANCQYSPYQLKFTAFYVDLPDGYNMDNPLGGGHMFTDSASGGTSTNSALGNGGPGTFSFLIAIALNHGEHADMTDPPYKMVPKAVPESEGRLAIAGEQAPGTTLLGGSYWIIWDGSSPTVITNTDNVNESFGFDITGGSHDGCGMALARINFQAN